MANTDTLTIDRQRNGTIRIEDEAKRGLEGDPEFGDILGSSAESREQVVPSRCDDLVNCRVAERQPDPRIRVYRTIRLAGSMGMRVVAEGIEDEVQARKLHELDCDMGQGWLYARAMSAHDLRDWLNAGAPKGRKVIPLRRMAV